MRRTTNTPGKTRPAVQRKSDSRPLSKQFKHGFGNLPIQAQLAMLKPGAPVPPPKASGSSRSLDSGIQAKAERSLGADFSSVRVHHEDGVAESYQAKAVTIGSDIHVASKSDPQDTQLMGHELAHVIQQGASGGAQTKSRTATAADIISQSKSHDTPQTKDPGGPPAKRHEVEADEAGQAVAQGRRFQVETTVTSEGVSPQCVDENSPESGVDWYSIFSGVGRSALTMARIVPGWGLVTGALEDVWRGYDDFNAAGKVPGDVGDYLQVLTIIRNVAALANDVFGHAKYCSQLTQDVVGVSGVGSWLVAITGPINEVGAWAKDFTQMLVGTLDATITIVSLIEGAQHPVGSDEWNACMDLATAFGVRFACDVAGLFKDVIDSATAGLAQGEVVSNILQTIKGVAGIVGSVKPLVQPIISKLIGIWLPKILNWGRRQLVQTAGEREPDAACAEEARTVINEELEGMSAMHEEGTGILEWISQSWNDFKDAMWEEVREFCGGEDPFVFLRDKMAEGISDFAEWAAEMAEIKTLAEQVGQMAQGYNDTLTSIKDTIANLEVPEIPDPEPADYGDSWLANAAEWVSDTASSAAASAMQWVRDQIQTVVDTAKGTIGGIVDTLLVDVEAVTEYAEQFQEQANIMIADAEAKGQEFAEQLSECESFADIFTLITDKVTEMLGEEEGELEPEVLEQDWSEIGEEISSTSDQFAQ